MIKLYNFSFVRNIDSSNLVYISFMIIFTGLLQIFFTNEIVESQRKKKNTENQLTLCIMICGLWFNYKDHST